jgi:DNA-binding NarL/FixJ family response regulator
VQTLDQERPRQPGARRPIVIVEGPPEAFRRAVEELRSEGWTIRDGFDADRPSPTEVRAGAVADAASAGRAVLAVLAGAGLVVHATAGGDLIDRLLDDLRHIGQVDHRTGAGSAAVSHEARAILGRLATGETLGEAAHALHLSRRTADRRLAEARRALGVERTVEAIARARRLGWLG